MATLAFAKALEDEVKKSLLRRLDPQMLCDYICTERDHDQRALGIEEYFRRIRAGGAPSCGLRAHDDHWADIPRAMSASPGQSPVLFDVPNPTPYTASVPSGLYVSSDVYIGNHTFKKTRFVRIANSSPDPDGTYKVYYLKVPPWMAGGRNAVAWTFGFHNHGYQPIVET